ncbi:MAG: serine hydrolase [bacterium]
MNNTQILHRKIYRLISQFDGKVGIAYNNLTNGDAFSYHAEERFPTASVIKLPIMVEVFFQVKEKKIKLTDILTYQRKKRAPGSGMLQHLSDGLNLTILDATTLMIILSDNTATNLVIDLLGVRNINTRMESLGFKNIKLFKKVFIDKPIVAPKLCKQFGLGMATPCEMNLLLELIYRNKIIDRQSCQQMIAIMQNQFYTSQLARWISGKEVWVASKGGAVNGVRNDVGIIHTPKSDWVLSIFCKQVKDQSWLLDNQAQVLVAKISKLIFDFYRK